MKKLLIIAIFLIISGCVITDYSGRTYSMMEFRNKGIIITEIEKVGDIYYITAYHRRAGGRGQIRKELRKEFQKITQNNGYVGYEVVDIFTAPDYEIGYPTSVFEVKFSKTGKEFENWNRWSKD